MKSIDEMRKSYNSFIERQRVGYEMTATMIGYIVEKMKNANIISNEVSISGRIKSFKSAYENTGENVIMCLSMGIQERKLLMIALELG